MLIETHAATHVGLVRAGKPNEDAVYASPPERHGGATVIAVADGLGGVPGGREASSAAIEAVRNARYAGEGTDAVRAAFDLARAAVVSLGGPATTLVLALVRGDHAWVANAGDSRAYLLREDDASQVTRDHSWAAEQIELGETTAGSVRSHPGRNVVTRCLGGDDQREDVHEVLLVPGDLLLLCTDGLWEPVDERALAFLAAAHLDRPLEDLATALIDAALARGGPDNASVAMLRLRE